MKNRKLYNRAIVDKLRELVEKYPDLRFGQILINAKIVQGIATSKGFKCQDPFFEESKDIWERMVNNKFVFNELNN